jgi:amino acid transporter
MVAGWDHLLPAWFTRLHPRFRTPVNSILFAAALILGLALVALAGVGQQEAFQLLENSAGSLYAFTYLVMFAIPLIGWKKIAPRPPLALRIAALSGFLMTLLFVVFAIIPIIPVANRFLFTAKILGGIIVASGIGVAIYATAGFRRSRGRDTPDAARS